MTETCTRTYLDKKGQAWAHTAALAVQASALNTQADLGSRERAATLEPSVAALRAPAQLAARERCCNPAGVQQLQRPAAAVIAGLRTAGCTHQL